MTTFPSAFCVGADAEALAGHADRGGDDDGLPAELATPGYGVRPEFDHDVAFQFGLPFALIAAVNGAAAGVGLAVARRYATDLATSVGPTALRTTKRQIYDDLLRHDVGAALVDARRLLADAMTTAEYREGVAAFRERRPPRFPAP